MEMLTHKICIFSSSQMDMNLDRVEVAQSYRVINARVVLLCKEGRPFNSCQLVDSITPCNLLFSQEMQSSLLAMYSK